MDDNHVCLKAATAYGDESAYIKSEHEKCPDNYCWGLTRLFRNFILYQT